MDINITEYKYSVFQIQKFTKLIKFFESFIQLKIYYLDNIFFVFYFNCVLFF